MWPHTRMKNNGLTLLRKSLSQRIFFPINISSSLTDYMKELEPLNYTKTCTLRKEFNHLNLVFNKDKYKSSNINGSKSYLPSCTICMLTCLILVKVNSSLCPILFYNIYLENILANCRHCLLFFPLLKISLCILTNSNAIHIIFLCIYGVNPFKQTRIISACF